MGISRRPQPPEQQSLLWAKVGLAIVGLATWFYGVRVSDGRVQWFGIGMVALAFILRFYRQRK